jgi:hypothetical protein
MKTKKPKYQSRAVLREIGQHVDKAVDIGEVAQYRHGSRLDVLSPYALDDDFTVTDFRAAKKALHRLYTDLDKAQAEVLQALTLVEENEEAIAKDFKAARKYDRQTYWERF